MIDSLKAKREAFNARARERRSDRKKGEYKPKKRGRKQKPVKPSDKRNYSVHKMKKSAVGKYSKRGHKFHHTHLHYDKPIRVNVHDQEEFERLKEIIREDIIKAYKISKKHKGMNDFIFKMITPFYDSDGNLLYDSKLESGSSGVGGKTGQVYDAPTSYSYGYSTARMSGSTPENMLTIFDEVLEAWGTKLKTSYEKIASRIDISGVLVEQTISIDGGRE